jgi:HK97 gp10 family phage protein
MADVEIKLNGLEAIFDLVDGVTDSDKVQKALGKCCALVERSAKQLAPKDTGELRRSITSKVVGDEGIVFTPLEYAPYVEYGTGLFAEDGGRTDVPWNYQDDKGNWHSTSGQKPQPFMRPALDTNRTQIMNILAEGLTKDD